MSLQTIGLGAVDRGTEGQFVAENIFPESCLPASEKSPTLPKDSSR